MPPPKCTLARHGRSRWALATPGLIPAALGGIVLIGWYAHSIALTQLRPALAPMQYNTALCLLLAGSALVALAWKRPRLSRILGGIVLAIGGLTLCEYLFQVDLRIDQLFYYHSVTVRTSNFGRMSPVAAICFLQVGFAMFLLSRHFGPNWRAFVAGSLGSIVIAVCALAILGYTAGLPGAYSWGQLTRIALHTACGLGLLGGGVLIFAWRGSRERDERTRRWLPVAVGLSAFTASLVLWWALETKQKQEGLRAITAAAENIQSQLTVRMEARVRSLERIVRRWEFSGRPAQSAWTEDMDNLVKDNPDIQAIEWIDAAHKIQWIAPLEGNEAKLHFDLTQEERRPDTLKMAQQQHQAIITPAAQLFRGGLGFLVYVPIYIGSDFDGFIAEAIEAQSMFDRYLPPAVAPGEAIGISEGAEMIFRRNASPRLAGADWVANSRIDLHGAVWNIRVWPTPELKAQLDSPLPEIELGAGLAASVLLALTTYLAQKSSTRAREAAKLNRKLQAALDDVKTLKGLLPICTSCKRVRDDTGYWNRIEFYLSLHSDASFSHGYCPECAAKAFQEAGFEVPEEIRAAQAEHRYD